MTPALILSALAAAAILHAAIYVFQRKRLAEVMSDLGDELSLEYCAPTTFTGPKLTGHPGGHTLTIHGNLRGVVLGPFLISRAATVELRFASRLPFPRRFKVKAPAHVFPFTPEDFDKDVELLPPPIQHEMDALCDARKNAVLSVFSVYNVIEFTNEHIVIVVGFIDPKYITKVVGVVSDAAACLTWSEDEISALYD